MTRRRATSSSGTRPIRAAATTSPAWTPNAQNCSFGRGHHGEHEQHGRQQLALRGEPVQRALPVHQQVPVRAAHVRPRASRPGPPAASGGSAAGGRATRRPRRRRTWRRCRRCRRCRSPRCRCRRRRRRSRRAGRRRGVLDSAGVDARVGADLLQPVGVGVGVRRDEHDERDGGDQGDGDEGERRDAARRTSRHPLDDGGGRCRHGRGAPGAVHEVGAHRQHRRRRRGR